MDQSLEAAFRYVERLLFGDKTRPGLTLHDLQRLVGYPAKGKGPYVHTLPAPRGVQAVRLYYYPEDPELELIAEIVDQEGKPHLRHFRWNGATWETPQEEGPKATPAPQGPLKVGEDYFLGFAPEEALALEGALRRGEALGLKYLLCPRCRTRIFYAYSIDPKGLSCPTCGNPTLLFKTFTGEERKDPLEALAEEQRRLRLALEELLAYLKRKLGP